MKMGIQNAGPRRITRVSLFLDLRVKPEDDNKGGTRVKSEDDNAKNYPKMTGKCEYPAGPKDDRQGEYPVGPEDDKRYKRPSKKTRKNVGNTLCFIISVYIPILFFEM